MALGVVVRFDEAKGYGFIAPDEGGDDVFVHVNELGDRGTPIACGTRVQFGVLDSGRGLKAYDVRTVNAAAPPGAAKAPAAGGALPSGALSGSRTAAAAAAGGGGGVAAKPAGGRDEGLAEGTCEVFSQGEFLRRATELLLASVPDLSAKQVLQVREALVRFACEHGWID